MGRSLLLIIIVITLIIIISQYSAANQFIKSSLYKSDSYNEFQKGIFLNSNLMYGRRGVIQLSSTPWCYYPGGIYISHIIEMDFPAREIYPSWNINSSKKEAGFIVYLRVSDDKINWSPWLYLGHWGKSLIRTNKIIDFSSGYVDIDSLYLKKDVKYIQYSIFIFSTYGRRTPSIKLFALSYGQRGQKTSGQKNNDYKGKEIRLPVPYRSQGDENISIRSIICSPTSVSMVMEYWGFKVPTSQVAELCYDEEYDIYGSWPMAVQCASQYGLKGWVQIFNAWPQVEDEIKKGIPVIATICYDYGELKGSFTPSSDGHVIVIIGFDRYGNPICNDPAGYSNNGTIIYNRTELKKAWLDNSGIGYIIFKD